MATSKIPVNKPVDLYNGPMVLLTKDMTIDLLDDVSKYKRIIFVWRWGPTGLEYQTEFWTDYSSWWAIGPIIADSNRWVYVKINSSTQIICGDVGSSGGVYMKRILGYNF
jgi:hypothetical protein